MTANTAHAHHEANHIYCGQAVAVQFHSQYQLTDFLGEIFNDKIKLITNKCVDTKTHLEHTRHGQRQARRNRQHQELTQLHAERNQRTADNFRTHRPNSFGIGRTQLQIIIVQAASFEAHGERQNGEDHPWLHVVHHVDRIMQSQVRFLHNQLGERPAKATDQRSEQQAAESERIELGEFVGEHAEAERNGDDNGHYGPGLLRILLNEIKAILASQKQSILGS